MAKERCSRKSFQDSLEDIKERMKEKRTKKLAKVATVNKVFSSKVKIIGTSPVSVRSIQDNNKSLALALEVEKCKTREAHDIILHLKREHQRLMFDIFMLRRKLNVQQGDNSGKKLASLKEIISKVTQNLLETANLLGPAHDLCFSDGSPPSTLASREVMRSAPSVAPEALTQSCESLSDAVRNSSHVLKRGSIPGRVNRQEESSKNKTPGKRLSRARRSSSSQTKSDDEESEGEADQGNNIFKNVSIRRRRPSSLNVCIEESSMGMSEDEQNLTSRCDIPEVIIVPTEECINEIGNDDSMDVCADQIPSKEEFISFINRRISSSTPEPKPKQSQPLKGKTESRNGREKVRKSRADGQAPGSLKKPWEKSKPRTRSKSRERSASKPRVSRDKMNGSLNAGDAYDFVFEESVHLTPFRQSKLGDDPEENKESVNDQSTDGSSSGNDEELNDSLYLPTKAAAKSHNLEKDATPLPLRPRSKRNKNLQQQRDERTESKSSDQGKPDVARGKRNARSGSKGFVETEIKPSVTDGRTDGNQGKGLLPKCIQIENSKPNLDDHGVQDNLPLSKDRNIRACEGTSTAQRIRLLDVTNLSTSCGNSEAKKHSFPFSENDRKMSGGCMSKRRRTVVVNYAEPSLNKKLRRGDPHTDTEFLRSPIFKDDHKKRKSINRKSLAKYNEAFVGCR